MFYQNMICMQNITVEIELTDDEYIKFQKLKEDQGFTLDEELIGYAVSFLLKLNESKNRGDNIKFSYKQYHPSGSTATFKI